MWDKICKNSLVLARADIISSYCYQWKSSKTYVQKKILNTEKSNETKENERFWIYEVKVVAEYDTVSVFLSRRYVFHRIMMSLIKRLLKLWFSNTADAKKKVRNENEQMSCIPGRNFNVKISQAYRYHVVRLKTAILFLLSLNIYYTYDFYRCVTYIEDTVGQRFLRVHLPYFTIYFSCNGRYLNSVNTYNLMDSLFYFNTVQKTQQQFNLIYLNFISAK